MRQNLNLQFLETHNSGLSALTMHPDLDMVEPHCQYSCSTTKSAAAIMLRRADTSLLSSSAGHIEALCHRWSSQQLPHRQWLKLFVRLFQGATNLPSKSIAKTGTHACLQTCQPAQTDSKQFAACSRLCHTKSDCRSCQGGLHAISRRLHI